MNKTKISKKEYFNSIAKDRLKWKKKNRHYYYSLEKYFKYFVPPQKSVLEVGCGTGELIASLNPSYGVGIDFSDKMIEIAKNQFPDLHFFVQDAEYLSLNYTFDYIILSDLLNSLEDIQTVLNNLRKVSNHKTRIIISNYNYLWEPLLEFGEKIGMKAKQPLSNWLSTKDINNLMDLEGYEIIRIENKMFIPPNIFFISKFFNNILANLPLLRKLTLINFIIARKKEISFNEASVSIIIPCKK
jgi:ubiquinone/menaquinone biosynthesis C-methylase UbiE